MRVITSSAVLLVSMTAAATAEVWKDVGNWTVMTSAETEIGCYARRMMDDGSEVQIGVMPDLQKGFFAIYNSAWTHIEDDAVGFVEFNFGNARFGGDSVGKFQNGVPGGYALFDNPAFVDAFAKGNDVEVIGSGGAVFNMDLNGTSKAVNEIRACQAAQK